MKERNIVEEVFIFIDLKKMIIGLIIRKNVLQKINWRGKRVIVIFLKFGGGFVFMDLDKMI